MRRMQVERHTKITRPSRQLDETVSLALRRALGERQPARYRKHDAEVDRLDGDRRAMLPGDPDEALVTEVHVRRDRRHVVIDQLVHRFALRCRMTLRAAWRRRRS